ncbi:MAG: 2-polyprenyl-3-methyl-5-hydroxy-6-metoxy-1,4-benzoquinol methylase [Parasphingorhabdus sp.]|jgi:2-polyprenyl-3-methyl-5-hydroxy-6-metoxy-1,4-benzoquinol methylase
MINCCPHAKSGAKVFDRRAKRYRKRFEKKGFEGSQRQLQKQITDQGVIEATVLEIGSGVGFFHQQLIKSGAASATGIDLSDKMVEQARQSADSLDLADRCTYIVGDFMQSADQLSEADITILDKVFCCYPDVVGLAQTSAALTRKVFAFTLPRNTLFNRIAEKIGTLLMRLLRSDFRPYVHSPDLIENLLVKAGFKRVAEGTTVLWLSRTYIRI